MAHSEPYAGSQSSTHDELTCSGYDSEIFLEPNKANDFRCVICQLIAKRPKTHYRLSSGASCKVIFCADCLKTYIYHYLNSQASSYLHSDAPCPFRCGATLTIRKGERNIGSLPRASLRRLLSLKMLCPYGRGASYYKFYNEHDDADRRCNCQRFNASDQSKLEKRIDSMLYKLTETRGNSEDELALVRKYARLMIDTLYP